MDGRHACATCKSSIFPLAHTFAALHPSSLQLAPDQMETSSSVGGSEANSNWNHIFAGTSEVPLLPPAKERWRAGSGAPSPYSGAPGSHTARMREMADSLTRAIARVGRSRARGRRLRADTTSSNRRRQQRDFGSRACDSSVIRHLLLACRLVSHCRGSARAKRVSCETPMRHPGLEEPCNFSHAGRYHTPWQPAQQTNTTTQRARSCAEIAVRRWWMVVDGNFGGSANPAEWSWRRGEPRGDHNVDMGARSSEATALSAERVDHDFPIVTRTAS